MIICALVFAASRPCGACCPAVKHSLAKLDKGRPASGATPSTQCTLRDTVSRRDGSLGQQIGKALSDIHCLLPRCDVIAHEMTRSGSRVKGTTDVGPEERRFVNQKGTLNHQSFPRLAMSTARKQRKSLLNILKIWSFFLIRSDVSRSIILRQSSQSSSVSGNAFPNLRACQSPSRCTLAARSAIPA